MGGSVPRPGSSPQRPSSRLWGWSSGQAPWGDTSRDTLSGTPLGQGGAGSGLPRHKEGGEQLGGYVLTAWLPWTLPAGCACWVGCADVPGTQISKIRRKMLGIPWGTGGWDLALHCLGLGSAGLGNQIPLQTADGSGPPLGGALAPHLKGGEPAASVQGPEFFLAFCKSVSR